MMTPEQFEDHLHLYGSDLTCWPDNLSVQARHLLEVSEAARRDYDDACLLDQTLNDWRVADPDPGFEARLLDLAPSAPAPVRTPRRASWFSLRIATTAAASLACAAFGFAIGLESLTAIQTTQEAEAFISASVTDFSETFWTGEEG